ncbi:hypothetical protein [Stenotrophomonas maltophilia]|uniref:hypothetical protein n=1 Tax=Stenotrophomonas maltophilia TaxID=40324 RepID=UPI0011B821DF|nr:hypothetical protein [Stenotrophomonas maltophilia]
MSSPFYNPAPIFLDNTGKPVAGGFLYFYESGTTTPKLTWSDEALTIPNPNPVPLDSAGRANNNIWIKGSYSVRLTDSLGAMIWTRNVSDGSTGQALFPPMEAGKFLTNDGSSYLWDDVRQMPDPTGSDGKVPVASGGTYILQPFPTIPPLNSSSGPGFFRIGDYMLQCGKGQCPATGTPATSTTVAIPVAYTQTPFVVATVGTFPFYTPSWGGAGVIMARPSSLNSIEVQMHGNAGTINSETIVVAPIDFCWFAFGKVT